MTDFVEVSICQNNFVLNISGTSGLAQLDAKQSSRMGSLAVGYYLLTTVIAVIVSPAQSTEKKRVGEYARQVFEEVL